MKKVIFVCLGNICRSPMAEAVFQQMVNDAGLEKEIEVDSCGTGGWHTGDPAHSGTRKVLQKHRIPYNGRSRQIRAHDMALTDEMETWIIVMDESNKRDVTNRFGTHPRLYKLLDFADNHPDVDDVPDPYYSGGFDRVYALVKDGCEGLFAAVTKA